MATRLALQDLQAFNENPTAHNASRLVTIPVLYNLLKHEEKERLHYSTSVTLLCIWVYERGKAVLEKLLVHGSPPDIELSYKTIEWKTVSGLRASQV
jgi:hypothetical protein